MLEMVFPHFHHFEPGDNGDKMVRSVPSFFFMKNNFFLIRNLPHCVSPSMNASNLRSWVEKHHVRDVLRRERIPPLSFNDDNGGICRS